MAPIVPRPIRDFVPNWQRDVATGTIGRVGSSGAPILAVCAACCPARVAALIYARQ